jgi:hypothetical protein
MRLIWAFIRHGEDPPLFERPDIGHLGIAFIPPNAIFNGPDSAFAGKALESIKARRARLILYAYVDYQSLSGNPRYTTEVCFECSLAGTVVLDDEQEVPRWSWSQIGSQNQMT